MMIDPGQDFQEDVAALLADDDPADGSTLSERGFLMAAEGTRHVWDTPEEDEAWAYLTVGARFIAPSGLTAPT